MSILTGQQIVEKQIVIKGLHHLVEENQIPSFGADRASYIFRHSVQDKKIFLVKPFQSVILQTLEVVSMPENYIGLLSLKHSYAQQGIILVTNNPIDPKYYGILTVRLYNTADVPIIINGAGGIIQMTVHCIDIDEVYETDYTNNMEYDPANFSDSDQELYESDFFND